MDLSLERHLRHERVSSGLPDLPPYHMIGLKDKLHHGLEIFPDGMHPLQLLGNLRTQQQLAGSLELNWIADGVSDIVSRSLNVSYELSPFGAALHRDGLFNLGLLSLDISKLYVRPLDLGFDMHNLPGQPSNLNIISSCNQDIPLAHSPLFHRHRCLLQNLALLPWHRSTALLDVSAI